MTDDYSPDTEPAWMGDHRADLRQLHALLADGLADLDHPLPDSDGGAPPTGEDADGA